MRGQLCALVMLALVVACDQPSPTGPTTVTPTDALITALRARGATVSRGEALPQSSNPFFSATAGSFGWIGGFGSSWISDPSKDVTMILLTQREFVSASGDPIHQHCQDDAYRAL